MIVMSKRDANKIAETKKDNLIIEFIGTKEQTTAAKENIMKIIFEGFENRNKSTG